MSRRRLGFVGGAAALLLLGALSVPSGPPADPSAEPAASCRSCDARHRRRAEARADLHTPTVVETTKALTP